MPTKRKATVAQHDLFDRVLESLHRAALDDTQWLEAATLIDEACNTTGNMLVFSQRRTADNDMRIFMRRFCHRGQRRDDWEYEYYEVWHPLDERAPRINLLPDSHLAHVSELFTPGELKTSPVYNEALRICDSQNSLYARMEGPDGSQIIWQAADPAKQGSWENSQIDMIHRLLPHIRQYVLVRDNLAGASALGASVAGLLDNTRMAVLCLDRKGRITQANDRARSLLRNGSGLIDRDGMLGASLPRDDANLQDLLARVLPTAGQGVSGTVTVRRPTGPPHLTLHISPVGGSQWDIPNPRVAALVTAVLPLSQPQVDAAMIAEALHLTRAESEVAAGLAQGRTVRNMATATGRQEASIRYHLNRIYRKLGLSGQTALVSLVLSLRGFPSPRA